MSVRFLFPLGFAASLGLALAAGAQPAENSPFIPAGAASGAATAADGSSYELRGLMTTRQGPRFCIYDPGTKTGVWVGLNEKGPSFVVSSADPAHGSVSIQANDGRHLMLGMREAKVVSSGVGIPQMTLQQPGQPGGSPPVVGNVVLHPTPETEQARLQAITDEVRRRRLLREQAQNAQPAPAH